MKSKQQQKKVQSRYTGQGTTTRANEMQFGLNQAPGEGSITRLHNLQSSVLPLLKLPPQTVGERQTMTAWIEIQRERQTLQRHQQALYLPLSPV